MALRHAKLSIYEHAALAAGTELATAARHTEETVEAIVVKAGTVGDGTIDIHKNGATILSAPIVPSVIGTVFKGADLAAVLAVSPTQFAAGDVVELIIAGTTGVNTTVSLRNHISGDDI